MNTKNHGGKRPGSGRPATGAKPTRTFRLSATEYEKVKEYIKSLREVKTMTLYKIADAILDSAIREYLEENTKSPEAVQTYAEGAMDTYITTEQAETILEAINSWLNCESPNSHLHYVLLEKPLDIKV